MRLLTVTQGCVYCQSSYNIMNVKGIISSSLTCFGESWAYFAMEVVKLKTKGNGKD